MKFSEFAAVLARHISLSDNTTDFTRQLFEHIIDTTDCDPLETYEDTTFRKFYNGSRTIGSISKAIMNNLEPSCFENYINDVCTDEQAQNIAEDFARIDYPVDPMNLGEDLSILFKRLIIDSTKRKKAAEIELDSYFSYLNQKFTMIKTLLYYDAPKAIYEFYIPNDIFAPRDYMKTSRMNPESLLFSFTKKYIVISGTGGLGKTMLMHHLVLTLIKKFDIYRMIPVAIQLKDYESDTDLMSYLRNTVKISNFNDYLEEGRCVFLLDGMDEVSTKHIKKFEKELDDLANLYPENTYILSSRPISDLVALNKFEVYTLAPFTKEQALALIARLVYRPETPELKENFRREVDEKLYETHREYVENPLLLTIMFMTYERYAHIPAKRHTFYREAFYTLAEKHDSTKIGFDRAYKTGMFPEEFALVLEEFCTRTYFDEKFELTDDEFDNYFSKLNILKRLRNNIRCNDLKTDLTVNLCIMYYDSGKYSFIHRSFQEYFCALYLSKSFDEGFSALRDFFEKRNNRVFSDYTFDMLYDIEPSRVEELIFIPYLEELFKICHSDDDTEQYWNFLEYVYPMIEYTDGDVISEYYNLPSSYVYDAILHKKGTPRRYIRELPFDECYCVETYLYLQKGEVTEIVYRGDFDERDQYKYDSVSECGHKCRFSVADVRHTDSELRDAVLAPTFSYMLEYREMKRILEDMQSRRRKSNSGLEALFR